MLFPSYFFENGTLIPPLLLFYLELGLVCEKINRFVEYNSIKCFNKLVQSVVNARRERDENLNSSVVAETMKLLANSSYGYQIMHRNCHSVTNYFSDMETHGAINTKFFKRLDYINDQLYEIELARAEIDHREPIIVGFFILQYADFRMLELYYNFFERFCDVNKFEELEMDTDSLYLSLSEKELYNCIWEESKLEWELMRTEVSKMISQLMQQPTSFLEPAAQNITDMTNESLVFSKRSFVVPKCCVYALKPIVGMTPIPTNTNSAGKI